MENALAYTKDPRLFDYGGDATPRRQEDSPAPGGMDLRSLIAAYALSAGLIHPYGHVDAGNRNDIPVSLDYKNLAENWDTRKGGNRAQTDLHGGGFEMQDRISGLANSPELNSVNALYKLLYLAGSHKMGGAQEGDVNAMERTSGNKNVNALLAASVLSDLYKSQNPGQNWNVGFTTLGRGTPGLTYNRRF